jgi:hypothetical protein
MLPDPELIDQPAVTPEGRFWTANCWVPEGAKVTVAGLTLGVGEAWRVTLAVPSTASEKEFDAVMVRVCCAGTLLGAVYSPLGEMLPTGGLTDQRMPVSKGAFRTENCWTPEGATVAVAGLTLLDVGLGCCGPVGAVEVPTTGATKMVALAVAAGLARLDAEIVTRVSAATELGAEYNPPEMVPTPCVIDHATCWLGLLPTVAMSCWDCPANK